MKTTIARLAHQALAAVRHLEATHPSPAHNHHQKHRLLVKLLTAKVRAAVKADLEAKVHLEAKVNQEAKVDPGVKVDRQEIGRAHV